MARTTLALTSFVSGEFGNKLTGRTDFDKYQSAAKTFDIERTKDYYNGYFDTDDFRYYGQRYGLTPELQNINGSFILDWEAGKIYLDAAFQQNNFITLTYVSDGLGTDAEMQVHKMAEEALYKHIAYAILTSKANIPEYVVNRYKRERRAAMRNAKLRLSNIKLNELTQIMRGKTKQIKH